MAKPPISRKNHYVPEWYQAGFSVAGTPNWLLDLSPAPLRPDGTPIVRVPRPRALASSFWEKDLYVTRFGEQLNDQVETILFQGIDDSGANAVRAYIQGDAVQMHHRCQQLFDYLGAQKLRTPKGLDWIRSRYPALDQVELLVEMQQLRQMFGTVWVEGVREIVSAEGAQVKFIVSDHPVTTFNAALAAIPGALGYPNDASILVNGTQTVFALDANHCLILTHVPYAKAPHEVSPLRKRTNARHFGHTIMRTDALIRERRLSSDEVIAINHLLKQGAHHYLAAGELEWLYPERMAPFDLTRTTQVLHPPQDELFHFGGEMYFGFEDGRTGYRDQFGRGSKDHEFVAKDPPAQLPAPEDACPCGNGDSFGDCCATVDPAQRPPWDVMGLRERTLALLRATNGILELDEHTEWIDVRRNLSDDQVVRLHRLYQSLWPEDTDLTELLPRPSDGKSRAIYMGLSDPRTMGESIISLVPLFDQVLVLNPFLNPRHIAPDANPLQHPVAHKQQALKNIAFLFELGALIEANKVVLVPDPGDFNAAFRQSMHVMAQRRTAGWEMSEEHLAEYRWLGEDDFRRSLRQLSPKALAERLKDAGPELSDEMLAEMVDYLRQEAEDDPLALLQPLQPGKDNGHFHILRGVNLELALYLAQVTGAIPVTDNGALWEHLHLHTRASRDLDGEGERTRFMTVPYRGYLHPDDALAASGLPSALFLRKILLATQLPLEEKVPVPMRLQATGAVFQAAPLDLGADTTHPGLVAPMQLTLSMPSAGFASATAQRLNVAFGRDHAPLRMPLAILRRTVSPA